MADFEDSFTVGIDTLLTAHSPDVGTAWTLVSGNNTAFDIEESDDTLRVQNSTLTFVMSDDLGNADCYVQGELASLTTMPGKYVALRIQDADNFIAWVNSGTGGGGMRLVKVIAGSITNLMTMQGVAGRVYKIEAEGTAIRFYEDDIHQVICCACVIINNCASNVCCIRGIL